MIDEDELPQDEWCTLIDTRLAFQKQKGSEQEENVRVEGKEVVHAQIRWPGFKVNTSYRILMDDGTIYAIYGATNDQNLDRIVDLQLIHTE